MKPQTKIFIENITIVLLIIWLIFNVSGFYKGYHNVDLSVNLFNIFQDVTKISQGTIYSLNATDSTNHGTNLTLKQMYMVGLQQMNILFIFTAINILCLGFLLGRKFKCLK